MQALQAPSPSDLRRRLDRLAGLPIRLATVRSFLLNRAAGPPTELVGKPDFEPNFDPGWTLIALGSPSAHQGLRAIAEATWWSVPPNSAQQAVDRLWKHSVAVAIGARRLAQGASLPSPEHWERVGLLSNLGLWSLAAVAPEVLADLFAVDDPDDRRDYLPLRYGLDLGELGLRLAGRWGGPPELIDAAWLHAGPLAHAGACARDLEGFRLIERAYLEAERTPWRLGLGPRLPVEIDPGDLKLRIAEVQLHCAEDLVGRDRLPDEERLLRSHVQLLRQADRWNRERRAYARVIDELTFKDSGNLGNPLDRERPADAPDQGPSRSGRRRRQRLRRAWNGLRADREHQRDHLTSVFRASRQAESQHEQVLRRDRLRSLAEFAAGAGHELNNPLAVILGRAQILLARTTETEAQRSLRAIIGQTRRAHRILRDLMYVANPPAPRIRPCQPIEIGRLVLRELADEAESRGIHLNFEIGAETDPSLDWTDPEALRHLVEILARNAIEAAPVGRTVQVSAFLDHERMTWRFHNPGRGLGDEAIQHLLDPFYCGRSAGRGLGLGLPRLARFLEIIGGDLRWRSDPDDGTDFQVTIPWSQPPGDEGAPPTALPRIASNRPKTS